MVTLPEMPPSIAALPRDERGYPVPWFVAWIDGKPEFRCADSLKFRRAVSQKLCWVCGRALDPNQFAFVLGPMCAINKTTAEPPCHVECATFSVMACPFLTKPAAKRREGGMPEACAGREMPGNAILRNPGVALVWACRGYELFNAGNGYLFRIANPAWVKFYAEGRKATREEILASIESGLPILQAAAAQDGGEALDELRRMTAAAMKFVPAA